MDGQHDVSNQPRDDHGRWTSGGGSFADGSTNGAIGGGVDAALAGLPIAVHDRLDAMVSSFGRQFLSEVAGTLANGKADGAGVLADTLNQVAINGNGRFGRANPNMVATLRGVATGLRPGQSAEVRAAAVVQLQDILARRDLADALGHTMEDVARTKQANVTEMARVLENEAGSVEDRPIMEAVGHTVLNRMHRNETALVSDVSGRYAHGQTTAAPDTRDLAIRLLNGQLADNTGGATHFYQPYAMAHPTPVARDGKGNYLTGAAPEGYEYVPGVVIRGADKREPPAFSVRPVWADGMQQLKVNGIPDSLAKFFIAPGSRHVR